MASFTFVPPDKMPLPRRRRHFRAYQDFLDSSLALAELGDPRYHKQVNVEGGPAQEWLVLTDGREVRFPPHVEQAIQAARRWVETGLDGPPLLPEVHSPVSSGTPVEPRKTRCLGAP